MVIEWLLRLRKDHEFHSQLSEGSTHTSKLIQASKEFFQNQYFPHFGSAQVNLSDAKVLSMNLVELNLIEGKWKGEAEVLLDR